tara:strand:- start:802 stop:960 length:159 start_codon:yes stop_codon:yes gene_type:complete
MIKVNFTVADIEDLQEAINGMIGENEDVFEWLIEDSNGKRTRVSITVGNDQD